MKKETKIQVLKTCLILLIIVGICFGFYMLLKGLGVIKGTTAETIDALQSIFAGNTTGAVLYIVLQILQVIFIPLNTSIFTIPAVAIFGGTRAFFVSWIGCTLGSLIMFLIARYGGRRLLSWIVGEKKCEKYKNALGKGKFLLIPFLLIPIFPDDIMSAAAGLSSMSFWYFLVVIVITRAIDTFCTVFIGVKAFESTIGIVLLGLFVVAMIVAGVMLTKHHDKFENFMIIKLTRKEKVHSDDNKFEQKIIEIKNEGK